MKETTEQPRATGTKAWNTPLRDVALLTAALAIGWWAHGERTVAAASPSSDLQFQLGADSMRDSLAVYSAKDRAIYVYRGASSGNDNMSCAYKYELSDSGGSVRRDNCGMGRLTP